MMPCPWSLSAIQQLKKYPEIEVGVHLTVISEYRYYRWGPLCPVEKMPSLVDESGKYFFLETEMEQYIANAKLEELEMEFRMQIDELFSHGIHPTHNDEYRNRAKERGLPVIDHGTLDRNIYN